MFITMFFYIEILLEKITKYIQVYKNDKIIKSFSFYSGSFSPCIIDKKMIEYMKEKKTK